MCLRVGAILSERRRLSLFHNGKRAVAVLRIPSAHTGFFCRETSVEAVMWGGAICSQPSNAWSLGGGGAVTTYCHSSGGGGGSRKLSPADATHSLPHKGWGEPRQKSVTFRRSGKKRAADDLGTDFCQGGGEEASRGGIEEGKERGN